MHNIELIRQYDIMHDFFVCSLVLNKRFLEVRKKQVYSELLDIIRLDNSQSESVKNN